MHELRRASDTCVKNARTPAKSSCQAIVQMEFHGHHLDHVAEWVKMAEPASHSETSMRRNHECRRDLRPFEGWRSGCISPRTWQGFTSQTGAERRTTGAGTHGAGDAPPIRTPTGGASRGSSPR